MSLEMIEKYLDDAMKYRLGFGAFYSGLSTKEKQQMMHELEQLKEFHDTENAFSIRRSLLCQFDYSRDFHNTLFDRLIYDCYFKLYREYKTKRGF